jgi:hypothetical protein
MTRRRKKTYAAILTLGALAVLIDRVMLAGPQNAAAEGTVERRSLSALGVRTPDAQTPSLAATPFPDVKARRNAPGGNPRDIFAPTAAARQALSMSASDPARRSSRSPRGDKDVTTAERFATDHRLVAIMVSGDVAVAVVDDLWLSVGDSIDGCRLIEITGTTATFRCATGEAALSVLDKEP